MSPEGHKPSEISLLKPLLIIGGLFLISEFAFSKGTRKEMHKRDGYACVICGSTSGCNCAHINHSKSNPRYDSVTNGRVLCDEHHYLDQYNRHGTENLGLNNAQNKWALATIWSKLTEDKKKRLPPPNTVEN